MPSLLSIHVQERALRCALCHGDAFGQLTRCRCCGTLLHQDCAEACVSCPTLGCRGRLGNEPLRDKWCKPEEQRLPRPRPGRGLLQTLFASSPRHACATAAAVLALVLALALLPREERGLRQLERAVQLYRHQEGRWPHNVGELWAVRHQAGGYPRRTRAGELYRFVRVGDRLLVLWQGEGGWRAHQIAEVRSRE